MNRLLPFLLFFISLLSAAEAKAQAVIDVAIVSIDNIPAQLTVSGIIPTVTVRNNGTDPQNFNVLATSTDGYSSAISVTALPAGESRQLSFAKWIPALSGDLVLTATTTLAGDVFNADNVQQKLFTGADFFPNNGWTTKSNLPAGQWGQPLVTQHNPNYDGALIYSISGNDQNFAQTSQVNVFNTLTNNWTVVAPIPQPRHQVNAVFAAGKIYVPGGYSASFSPTSKLEIYDFVSGTWSTGAPMPQATGDYAIGIYKDTFIYVIGGYSGAADINTVQVYNIATNTWTLATPKPGNTSAGLRGAISNGRIIIGGGYSQSVGGSLATAYQGVINPENPLEITWTSLPDLPYGTVSRHAAGAFLDRVYFAGGDPNGAGNQAKNQVYAYNTVLNRWELGPVKPSLSSNIVSLAPVLINGKAYLVSMGGYNGAAVTNVNEWLELGDYCNLTATTSQQDIACNDAETGTATVTPTGGDGEYQYTWNTTPAQTTPVATNLAAGDYEVSIRSMGCTITKNFTITEPAKIVLTGSALTQGTVGVSYDNSVTATLGSGDYEYSISTGILPTGVNFSVDGVLAGTPTQAGNFTVTIAAKDITCNQTVTANFSLVIAKGSQTISLVTVPNKTYGDLPFLPGATATSGLPVSYSSSDNTIAEGFEDAADGNKWKLRIHNAGTVTITVNQVGSLHYNAAVAKTFSLTVNPKPVTIVVVPGATLTKVYDGTNMGTFDASDLGFTTGNIINGDIVQLQVTANTSTYDNKNAGTGKTLTIPVNSVSLTGAQAGNYSIANTGTISSTNASITAASLSITVHEQTKEYGTNDPNFSYSNTGLLNGDAITGSSTRSAGEDVGTYPITQGTLSAGNNYTISFTGSTFTITKAPQQITWTQDLLVGCSGGVSSIQLTATSSSGNAIVYSVANTNIATINGSTLTPLAQGTTLVTASLAGNNNYEEATPVVIPLQYMLTGTIRQHWADAIFFDNSGNKYVQWQWYKNGNSINGANNPYYSESSALQGIYYATATDRSGNIAQTCPLTLSGSGTLSAALRVAPNPARPGTTATITCNYQTPALSGAKLIISNMAGTVMQQLTTVQQTNTVQLPAVSGVYVITLQLSNGHRETVNVLVK